MRSPFVSVLALALAMVLGCTPTSDRDHATNATGSTTADVAASIFGGSAGNWVDLTYAFSKSTTYWPTDTVGFEHLQLAYGRTEGGWFYSSYRYGGAEHGGTHLDAPIHFAEGKWASDEIPLSKLMGPAVVVDVSDHTSADYQATVEDLTAWESTHGQIPPGAIVLLRTGWGKRYDDRVAYLGTALTGPEAVPMLHFPGLSPAAAQWLVDNRDIAAFGLDTPSVDYGQSNDFRSHVILYERNIAGFENVAQLDQLPEVGAFAIALPMKIAGGSGGPLRIIAFVPR